MSIQSQDMLDSFDPETQIVIIWGVDDVRDELVRPDLTIKQAKEVLKCVSDEHDASCGVCWDTLRDTADFLFPREEENNDN